MPDTLRLPDGGYMRRFDVQTIVQLLYTLQCVEMIGFSNIGKSSLMRLLAQPDVWTQELGEAGREVLPVYIDCNRMLELSDHGFYELVLRCLQESSEGLAGLPELSAAYETAVSPASEFQVPLSFNRGLTAVLQASKHKVVLLFDEFDEPFSRIDSRVFINLRALKDRHNSKLVYITATERPLLHQRPDDHCGEFCELFTHHAWHLAPLTRSDVERFVHRYRTVFDIHFTATDIDFIYEWAGGHPRLLSGVCRVLEAALEGSGSSATDASERWQLHQQVARTLHSDSELNSECAKIWNKLAENEQTALLALHTAEQARIATTLTALQRQHLLIKVEGKHHLFCRLFAEYVQHRGASAPPGSAQLWVDVERGEVLVNGKAVETLTNLEYRLLVLLFQNRDKLIDKYEIVTNVWGESYIDEVDDARIEKLVSRVRQKIESDASAPKFLITVRGRGYKLVVE